MNLVERQKKFFEETKLYFHSTSATRVNKLFGVSNSAKIIDGGIQIGVTNLNTDREDTDAFILNCVIKFPPEDEVYFAIHVKKDKGSFLARLADMKRLGAASGTVSEPEEDDDSTGEEVSTSIKYAKRNNNVAIYLGRDGRLWMRNWQFWNSLDLDRSPFGPGVEPDEIVVSLYPPTASARRSLLAREFIGWLGTLTGREKIHELQVWKDEATLGPDMQRMPATMPIADIESAVATMGGHYPNGEIRRLHASLNFLAHKHFVILAGLSGTGKTQLAIKYARAVHGI